MIRTRSVIWTTLLQCVVAAAAFGDDDIVVVGRRGAGGAKEFVLTVTNRGARPITSVEHPHFLGLTPIAPDGWEESRMTGNPTRHQKRAPGILEYRAKNAAAAIRKGQSVEFRLLLDVYWPGVMVPMPVTIGLDDGTEIQVSGVACPYRVSYFRQYFPVIGLGVVFAIFILYKLIRGKRESQCDSCAATSDA